MPSIIDEAAAAFDLPEGDERREIIGAAAAKGYMAGVRAGQAEMAAQATEQGFDISVESQRAAD